MGGTAGTVPPTPAPERAERPRRTALGPRPHHGGRGGGTRAPRAEQGGGQGGGAGRLGPGAGRRDSPRLPACGARVARIPRSSDAEIRTRSNPSAIFAAAAPAAAIPPPPRAARKPRRTGGARAHPPPTPSRLSYPNDGGRAGRKSAERNLAPLARGRAQVRRGGAGRGRRRPRVRRAVLRGR